MIVDWACQTGLAVTALVIFVLLVRKPVAYSFGAHVTYALWALPLVRIILPDFTLSILPAKEMRSQYAEEFIRPSPVVNMAAQEPASVSNISVVIMSGWLSVAIVWLTCETYRQYVFVKKQKNSSIRFSNCELIEKASRASKLKACPEIRISNTRTGPLVTGLRKPLIILPRNFETGFTSEQQYFALLHELTHIKRSDLWVALIALIFRAINWPNPIIHFAAKRFRTDQEAACDASVLSLASGQNSKRVYAETLLQAAKTVTRTNIPAPVGLTIYHPLKERLTMMTQRKNTNLMSKLAMSAAVIGALVLTSPIHLAVADDTELAGKAEMKQISKQVIKSVEIVDGQEVKTHYEIIDDENGKKAFKIDPDGTRTEIDPAKIEATHKMHVLHEEQGHSDMDVTVIKSADGQDMRKKIKIISKGEHPDQIDIDTLLREHGSDGRVFIKKIEGEKAPGQRHVQVYKFSSDNDFEMEFDGEAYDTGIHSKAMVSAASGLLDGLNEDNLSDKAKRKIEKARKALKEAEKALAEKP